MKAHLLNISSEVVRWLKLCTYSQLLSFYGLDSLLPSSPVFLSSAANQNQRLACKPSVYFMHGISAIARQAMKDACDY